MVEQLDLPELERRWKESKSTIGRQMFALAQIRLDLRALEQERARLRAAPAGSRQEDMLALQSKVQNLIRERGAVNQLHQYSLSNHRFILKQLAEVTGHDWTSNTRRARHGTPATVDTPFDPASQPKPIVLSRRPDPNYGRSGSGGYC